MKFTPKTVFILEDGKYTEITYEEFCQRQEELKEYADKLFLPLHSTLMEVTKEDYDDFYKMENRRKYVQRWARIKKTYSYEVYTTEDFNGEDMLVDLSVDIEEEVELKIMGERIHEFLKTLSPKDRDVIKALYFDEQTEREYAKEKGIFHNAVHVRKMKILKKLKKFLEN